MKAKNKFLAMVYKEMFEQDELEAAIRMEKAVEQVRISNKVARVITKIERPTWTTNVARLYA